MPAVVALPLLLLIPLLKFARYPVNYLIYALVDEGITALTTPEHTK